MARGYDVIAPTELSCLLGHRTNIDRSWRDAVHVGELVQRRLGVVDKLSLLQQHFVVHKAIIRWGRGGDTRPTYWTHSSGRTTYGDEGRRATDLFQIRHACRRKFRLRFLSTCRRQPKRCLISNEEVTAHAIAIKGNCRRSFDSSEEWHIFS